MNKLLRERLSKDGYHKVMHTPGLFKHKTQEICFTLVVDDISIKFGNPNNIEHLLVTLKKHCKIEVDWDRALYCGITLEWNYIRRHINFSMPNYVKKVIERYKYIPLAKQ